MRRIIIISLVIFFIFITSSCVVVSINGSMNGITNNYKKLSDEQKSKIKKLESFDNLDISCIYEINAKQLKEEMNKYPKSIVYVFTNNCGAETCLPLGVYESYAEKNGYKLFLIMNGYSSIYKTIVQKPESQLFSINVDYYKAKIRAKYIRYFENELMGNPKKMKSKEYYGNIFFFEYGEFKNVYRELP